MKTANFICTAIDGKESIIMGFMDGDDRLEMVYETLYGTNIETLYISIKPIQAWNKKFVIL